MVWLSVPCCTRTCQLTSRTRSSTARTRCCLTHIHANARTHMHTGFAVSQKCALFFVCVCVFIREETSPWPSRQQKAWGLNLHLWVNFKRFLIFTCMAFGRQLLSRAVIPKHCAVATLVCHESSSGILWKMVQFHLTGLKTDDFHTPFVSFFHSHECISVVFN